MARLFVTVACLSVLLGCIDSYTCEGDHKEVYWNISPTTNGSPPPAIKPQPEKAMTDKK